MHLLRTSSLVAGRSGNASNLSVLDDEWHGSEELMGTLLPRAPPSIRCQRVDRLMEACDLVVMGLSLQFVYNCN